MSDYSFEAVVLRFDRNLGAKKNVRDRLANLNAFGRVSCAL